MKVSVLMSVYNGQKYLEEAIESVLKQTFSEYEFLIMDDGSSDSSKEIIESFSLKDRRIRVFFQDNSGLAQSLNTLIVHSQGEYLARMDADDVSLPQRFASQVEYLDRHKEVGVLATAIYEIAPNSLPFTTHLFPNGRSGIKQKLQNGENPIIHGSVMMRKEVLGRLGKVVYRTRIVQDLDLWVRLSSLTEIDTLNVPLYKLRATADSVTAKSGAVSAHVVRAIMNEGLTDEVITEGMNKKIKDVLKEDAGIGLRKGLDELLNGKALFRRKQYFLAIRHFFIALRHAGTRRRALMFIGLAFMGKLGWVLHSFFNGRAYIGEQFIQESTPQKG